MKLQSVIQDKWHILAYCSDRGNCELLEFLYSLDSKYDPDVEELMLIFRRTSEDGPSLRREVSKPITGQKGLFEFIQGRLRVFYFYDKGKMIICAHGSFKTSQKTRLRDIRHALSVRKRYLEDKKQNKIIIQE